MIPQHVTTNKRCKKTEQAFKLPVMKWASNKRKMNVIVPASEINCKQQCALIENCIGVTGLVNGTEDGTDDWCIGCRGPMDQPFDWYDLRGTGNSYAYTKEELV